MKSEESDRPGLKMTLHDIDRTIVSKFALDIEDKSFVTNVISSNIATKHGHEWMKRRFAARARVDLVQDCNCYKFLKRSCNLLFLNRLDLVSGVVVCTVL